MPETPFEIAIAPDLADARETAPFRGSFKFNNNHFPIQNFCAAGMVKDKEGRLTEVNRGVIRKDDMEPYSSARPLP